MTRRVKPEQSQRERFEQAARALGVTLDEAKLKEALRKIAPLGNPSVPEPDHGKATEMPDGTFRLPPQLPASLKSDCLCPR